MSGTVAAYVVAIAAMLFSGLSVLALIIAVKHFDSLEAPAKKPEPIPSAEPAAV